MPLRTVTRAASATFHEANPNNPRFIGRWTADSSLLSFTLADMKSIPKSYVINGTAIAPSLVAKFAGPSMPTFSDGLASGASDELKILMIKDNEITLAGKSPAGNAFTLKTYRQH